MTAFAYTVAAGTARIGAAARALTLVDLDERRVIAKHREAIGTASRRVRRREPG
jgi:hypothetical protein